MESLENFLIAWGEEYRRTNESVALFDEKRTAQFTLAQRQLFAKAFYHARGHFSDFLWEMGSSAPDEKTKAVILENFRDEFGGRYPSHEQLYIDFASALGVNIPEEKRTEETYLPFIRAFNKGHIDYLRSHGWDGKFSAFSAYEYLDNVDYENLYRLVKSFGLGEKALKFFDVHREVTHYEDAKELLRGIWHRNPDAVRDGFAFIGNHQTRLWIDLNKTIVSLPTPIKRA